jgi:glycosyltransferase involved in cell wall biosynthesis
MDDQESHGQSKSSPTVAAVVLARDEEKNIQDCLRSVSWADKLCVLIDPRTIDRTSQLAQEADAEVQSHRFVDFAAQRNAALKAFVADWILFVDADERGTPGLGPEVRRVLQDEAVVGWWVPRQNWIWGRWIRHAGWYPDHQLRLLKRGRAQYDPERQVHEVVVLEGQQGYLQNPLIHHNYATVKQFWQKQDYYSGYEASVLVEQGIRPRAHSLILQPWREFWRRYKTLQGYKDGGHGLLLSALMAYFTFVAYWRARGLWKQTRGGLT